VILGVEIRIPTLVRWMSRHKEIVKTRFRP
jgi:hypothetical protein